MFSSQFSDPMFSLTSNRLTRIKSSLRSLTESTLEGYQAEVYSAVNGALNLAGQMQPLILVPAEAPATVGTIAKPLQDLTEDAADIVDVISLSEATASDLYNLAATAQNSVRQDIREAFYASSAFCYLEPFLNSTSIASNTGSLDFVTGQATLSESKNTQVLTGTIVTGPGSSPGVTAKLQSLTSANGSTLTSVSFSGSRLELILSFDVPTILNRIKIELATFEGLELSTLTSSTSGSAFQDVLADLNVTNMIFNGVSGKLSGDVVLDFPARYISQMRIVFNDRVNAAQINLQSISFWARQFTSASTLTSKLISQPLGKLRFSTDESTWGRLTTILHQVSTDGVHYATVTPGTDVNQPAPFYYKASLQVVPSAFSDSSAPINQDPAASNGYILTNTTAVNIGSNILQRSLVFGSIDGPVTLQEVPLPGTFQVFQAGSPLAASNYTFVAGVLSFPAEVFNIKVTYQLSSVGTTAVSTLQSFYTPILREVRFQTA